MEFNHISVMPAEVIQYLDLKPGKIIVDGTLGGAGHSRSILERILPGGRLIATDQDLDAIANAKKVFSGHEDSVTIVHDNFVNLPEILKELGVDGVDGILLDLGVSQHQLKSEGRGFSFMSDDPLDMRMNRESDITAEKLVNELSARELADIMFKYGEERFSRQIAKLIVSEREKQRITTCSRLSEIITSAIPEKARRKQKIHPATRAFQGLRIAVNQELTVLSTFMDSVFDLLNPGGILCVLSFHSLEDRIVKKKIRELEKECVCPPGFPKCVCDQKKQVRSLNRKPLPPGEEEIAMNPMARSTKLRAAVKL